MRKSKGFGIHSPFAFYFVTRVLKEHLPYYCYADIDRNRKAIIKGLNDKVRNLHIISSNNAKLLFRVTNYYNPQSILQIGSNYGASSTAMLMVSSKSRIMLYDAEIDKYQNDNSVTKRYSKRISFEQSIGKAIEGYNSSLKEDDIPFILVNKLNEEEYSQVSEFIKGKTEKGAIIILRNLTNDKSIKNLFLELKENLTYGMIFTNEQIAFVIINPKLPRQNFSLWF